MVFNPKKCEHLRFTRKRQNTTTNSSYTLHNIVMSKVPTGKYLGGKLQSSLQWNENIDFITGKVASRHRYIRHSIPSSLSHLWEKAYKRLTRPILEYACAVWDPAISMTQSSQLEAVQRRAAWTVNNIKYTDHTSSTTKLINDVEWDELKVRRERNVGSVSLERWTLMRLPLRSATT